MSRVDSGDLLQQLYQQAETLPERRCQTTRWKRFVRFRANQEILLQFRREVEAIYQDYSVEPVWPEEISAETVAGHRLLLEGLELWMEAIQKAMLDPQDEDAIWLALDGNRLLIAVNQNNRKLKELGQDASSIIENFASLWEP